MVEPTSQSVGATPGIAAISPQTWLWWMRRQSRFSLTADEVSGSDLLQPYDVSADSPVSESPDEASTC
jgi:hypothetical protein